MKGKTEGYDADKDSYCDLVEAGIIDPAKVVRTALQNAASVAVAAADHVVAASPRFPGRRPKRVPAAIMTTAWAAWAAWEAWAAWVAWAAWRA